MKRLIYLAWPVVLSSLGLIFMGLVDLLFVGRVSPEAVGAVGIGTSLLSWGMMFGIGLLSGLDPLAAQAFGAGKRDECDRYFTQAIWLSFLFSVPIYIVFLFFSHHMGWMGIHPSVQAIVSPFIRVLAPSILPALVFTACRQYLQALGRPRPAVILMIIANGLNAFFNWVFVFGHLGFSSQGAIGTAWATLGSRIFLAFGMITIVRWVQKENGWKSSGLRLNWDWARIKKLSRLGLPAGFQLVCEVGVFATTTALAGRLAPVALASHQVVLQMATVTFIIPLGVGAASATLVGHDLGREDGPSARLCGWRAFGLSIGFMCVSALLFLIFPHFLLGLFTTNPEVIAGGISILFIAAVFQISDGAQAVLTGILRGVGDTKTPAFITLVGHWLIGLPVGVYLCFERNWGLPGLWVGLSVGLTTVAVALTVIWVRVSRRLLISALPMLV